MPVGFAPACPEPWRMEGCRKFIWKPTDGVFQTQNFLFSGRQRVLYNNSSLPTGVRERPWGRESIYSLSLGLILVSGMHMLQREATHDEWVCCRRPGLRKVSRARVMLCVANPGPFPGETAGRGRNRAENGQYVSISVTWSKSKVRLLNTVQTYVSIQLLLMGCSCFVLTQSKLCLSADM